MSSDPNLESTLREIRALKAALSNGTFSAPAPKSEPSKVQNALRPKHKNGSTNGRAASATGNASNATKDTANMVSSSKSANGTSPSTTRASGANGTSGTEVKQASSPTHGNSAHPTPTFIHVGSRDNTHDGFGGCSSPCNRYGEVLNDNKQDYPSFLSASDPVEASADSSNGMVNGTHPTQHHSQDVESTNSFTTVQEKHLNPKEDQVEAVSSDPNEPTLDRNAFSLELNGIATEPNSNPSPPNPQVPPKSTSPMTTYPFTPAPAPTPAPGARIIERTTRIHEGGLGLPPQPNSNSNSNSKPVPSPGQTLLTTISPSGTTTYSLSDKNLLPGQRVVENIEVVYEGFVSGVGHGASVSASESQGEGERRSQSAAAAALKTNASTPSTPRRRWSWLGSLGSPGSANGRGKEGLGAGLGLGMGMGQKANPSGGAIDESKSTSNKDVSLSSDNVPPVSEEENGTPTPTPAPTSTPDANQNLNLNTIQRPAHSRRNSSFFDTLRGRRSGKAAVTSTSTEKGKMKEDQSSESAQAPTISNAQSKQSQGERVPEQYHWFDKLLDGLGGRRERVVQN